MEQEIYSELLDETFYINKLPNGLNCYIIPKKDYVEKQAIICTNYGGMHNDFSVNGKTYNLPEGIAHFLEHKLFEDKKISIFEEFSKNSADVNAFTSSVSTAYYFNCIENFDKNLESLLNFTNTPHFTDENVEKEKNIIIQEIKMYQDSPYLKVYLNLLEALFEFNPIRKNIAGTIDSIKEINKDMLYLCYETFYYPENKSLICIGDFNRNSIYETANKYEYLKKPKNLEKLFHKKEAKNAFKPYIEETLALPVPIFNLGFKDSKPITNFPKDTVTTKILMDIVMGASSSFYYNLYEKELIDAMFSLDYSNDESFSFCVFSNQSSRPKEVYKLILEELNDFKAKGASPERFEQIRKKHIGRTIRSLNDIDYTATSFVNFFSKNTNPFEVADFYNKITIEDVNVRARELFSEDNYSLSVLY